MINKKKRPIFYRLFQYMLKFWYLTLFAFIFSMIANYLALLGPMYLGNAMNAISNKTGVLIDEVIYNFGKCFFVILPHLFYLIC